MHLINTKSYQLRDFIGDNIPDYAILSHCWASDEVSLQGYMAIDKTTSRFQHSARLKKIRDCCQLAIDDNIDWVWVDACCIDKKSSAELSEAINSMFAWYENSKVCYAFLEDAQERGDLADCRWFTRGWTLQELLAPQSLRFYNAELEYLGDRSSLCDRLERITRIPREFISEDITRTRRHLSTASIAQRMSWVANRHTTRSEDIAYSRLGIFGVNMPLLYGEGPRAFVRLQEHIIAQSQDESIFAWASTTESSAHVRGMLASHPAEFRDSGDIISKPFPARRPPYSLTNSGLAFPVIPASILQRLVT